MRKLALFALFCASFSLSAQSNCWTNLSTQNSGIPSSAFENVGPKELLLETYDELTRCVGKNSETKDYDLVKSTMVDLELTDNVALCEPGILATSYELHQNDLPSGVYAVQLKGGERLIEADIIIEE